MFDFGKRKFARSKRFATNRQRGQSLVEAAVMFPLLLFMFLGLIEVGWAIRGYLVLLTSNRETARFAARGEYLNFQGRFIPAEQVADRVGYNFVLTHTNNILASNRLGLGLFDDGGNPLLQPLIQASQGSFIISHYKINTRYPCRPSNNPSNPDYRCTNACANENYWDSDDEILHPGMEGYEHFIYTRPAGTTYTSRIDPAALAEELIAENNALNCAIMQRRSPAFPNPELSVNSVIVVEAFYDQPQLLGVPFLSNTFTDPILLYSQTKMRITSDKLSQGEGCEVLPIAINEDALYDDEDKLLPIPSTIEDIREGPGSGNFGWLTWRNQPPPNNKSTDETITASPSSEQYLSEAITNPALSVKDYINPENPSDRTLHVDDWISGSTGQVASNGVAKTAVVGWINPDPKGSSPWVTIPVWDEVRPPNGGGSNVRYHIVNFALMEITGINFQGNPKTISGIFRGWDTSCFDPNAQ